MTILSVNRFTAFLKLIRLPNLLMIALTQYLLRWCVIIPLIRLNDLEPVLSEINFFLVSLSTVFIAAAGYVINDYFDLKIDRINKPDRIIVGKIIKRRVAMGAHVLLSVLGIGLGFYLGQKVGVWKMGFIHVASAGLLWYYSVSFKRQVLVGNVVIALLAAVVPITSALFDLLAIRTLLPDSTVDIVLKITIWYSGFAFITSIIREIIKDMEDIQGDREAGCKTLPIAIGIPGSKVVVVALSVITVLLLIYVQIKLSQAGSLMSVGYVLVLIQLPLIILIARLIVSTTKLQYRYLSGMTKFIMLSGMLALPVIYLFNNY